MAARAAAAGLIALALTAALLGNSYQLFILTTLGLTTMAGLGLNILLGLTGQVSLGHVGFYAIGAYTVAILTTTYGVGFWVALAAAALITTVVGTLLALPALRVSGPYLAMVTIAFAFIVEHGSTEWRGLTGGANGLLNIPPPAILGWSFDERALAMLVVGLTAVAMLLFQRLAGSPWGLAMRAVRDSEIAAGSIGLDSVRVRTTAFVLSAVVTGVAGAFFAPLTAFVSPSSFSLLQSILFLLVVIVGGAGTVAGPLLGSLVAVLLPEVLAGLAEYRLLFFGGLLLVVLWLAPDGIVGGLARLRGRRPPGPAPQRDLDVAVFLAERASGAPLRIEGLGISFGGLRAVDGVTFTARGGRVTSLIGPNGAGKTTVLNLICGLYRPDQGSVTLGPETITGSPSHAVARAGIARTYQTSQLFGRLTVIDNVVIARRRGRLGSLGAAVLGRRDAPELRREAESLLAYVGYRGPVDRLADELPHVDRRLVEIARALAAEPQVLMLDEPAAGLGSADTERLGGLLRGIAATGVAVVLIEHDMRLVMGVSDEVVVLDAGRCIARGAPDEVRRDPAVLRAYLGEGDVATRPRPGGWRPGEERILAVERLDAAYGAAPVLRAIDLAVRSGELVAVLGANGAGKSTLLRVLSGLHRPLAGSVRLGSREVTTLPAHARPRAGLVLVPEGRQVFPELSVLDNIRLGAYGRGTPIGAGELEGLLARFPALRSRLGARAGLLSGGEQQMLALARGLAARPRVLLLDEPSLGLAPTLVAGLFEALTELRDDGTTILLVDQMATLALAVADRGYVMESGRIVHEGPAAALRGQAVVEQAYLGAV
ncbi:MAG TPA: branched-chain amino acid ABC transporter ATP-binding protein/permease [Methylomirabilota bacterium]|nr:branched-chain amino acid ABC transporter ATP-binding protein/permease [Methylomirabilota bacterium]